MPIRNEGDGPREEYCSELQNSVEVRQAPSRRISDHPAKTRFCIALLLNEVDIDIDTS